MTVNQPRPADRARTAVTHVAGDEPIHNEQAEDVLLTIAPFTLAAAVGIAAAIGIALVALLRPAWIDALLASLDGAQPKVFWYLSRASGLVAFGLIWVSMALGLAVTNKLAWAWPGGPTVVALHNFTGLLGLSFGMFHGLVLTGDHYTNYTLGQVLVPFASVNYRPEWVGIGQLAFYLAAIVALSFYARRWIGHKVWRALHFCSFAVFALTLAHGLMSGTDSASVAVLDMYWMCGVSIFGLTLYRIVTAVAKQPRQPARG